MDFQYLTRLSDSMRSGIDIDHLADSLSATQYRSKKWLVDELTHINTTPQPKVLIIGGWYGSYLVPMLYEAINPSQILFNDVDETVVKAASILHPQINTLCFNVEQNTARIHEMDVDVIINTSCEHMFDMSNVTNKNKHCLFVLQSCDNANDPGHINVATNTNHFLQQTGLIDVKFKGRLALGHKNRFMVMGLK